MIYRCVSVLSQGCRLKAHLSSAKAETPLRLDVCRGRMGEYTTTTGKRLCDCGVAGPKTACSLNLHYMERNTDLVRLGSRMMTVEPC